MSTSTQCSPNTAMTVVSLAVLLSTSTWFSGTAVRPALIAAWGLSDVQSAWLTISVQLGFVVGTLLYAVLNIADVFNARRVFLVSALLGAVFNAAFGIAAHGIVAAVVWPGRKFDDMESRSLRKIAPRLSAWVRQNYAPLPKQRRWIVMVPVEAGRDRP